MLLAARICVNERVASVHLDTPKNFNMPSQDEKSRRKQILEGLAKKQHDKSDQSLPLSRGKFQQLSDFLDAELADYDDALKLTKRFLSNQIVSNVDEVIQ